MNKIVVGPVPGYEHVKFLPKKQAPKRNLKWHTSYGTIYVYDDQGNSCSISRGNNGTVDVDHMYSDGERSVSLHRAGVARLHRQLHGLRRIRILIFI